MSVDTFLISLRMSLAAAAAYCFLLLSTASPRLRFETTTPGKHKIALAHTTHLISPSRERDFPLSVRELENPCSAVAK